MNNPIQEKRLRQLEQFEAAALTALAIIRDIREGKSESAACRDAGTTVRAFRHNTASCSCAAGKGDVAQSEFSKAFLHPAERLYLDLMKLGPTLANMEKIPCGVEASICPLMREVLSRKARMVLHCLYWEGMTLRGTGRLLGKDKDTVYQIRELAFQKLRRPCNLSALSCGYAWKAKTDAARRKAREEERKTYRKEQVPADAEGIEVLRLSNRAYNALGRNGIKTLGDLQGKSVYHLLAMDYVGGICAKEIAAAYEKYMGQPMDE